MNKDLFALHYAKCPRMAMVVAMTSDHTFESSRYLFEFKKGDKFIVEDYTTLVNYETGNRYSVDIFDMSKLKFVDYMDLNDWDDWGA